MIVTYNNTTNSWSFEQEDTSFFRFQFNFVEEGTDLVVFDNLSFGATVSHVGSKKKFEVSFPPAGMEYVSTEEKIVEAFDIENIVNGERYDVYFWCENAGRKSEYSFDFTARRLPTKPYPSWRWNEEEVMWEPPMEHPQDETKLYSWDEESTSWKVFDGVIEQTNEMSYYKDRIAVV